ncbi:hypothetical protein [Aquitalea pelogenes]|uniref:hypothetical protein n=1 Tax=Aquitalea pelogenes TaxID=1293573 RepID=UPI00195BBF36|nr:hypothetical protein [Aquitalea pelogenes]
MAQSGRVCRAGQPLFRKEDKTQRQANQQAQTADAADFFDDGIKAMQDVLASFFQHGFPNHRTWQ